MTETNNIFDQAKAVLKEYIHKNGMRQTLERQIVLQYICDYNQAFTAEQIIKDVCEVEHISVATIYNTLDLLVRCGLLTRLPAHIGAAFEEYELVLLHANRLRFVCSNCGRIVEIKDKALEDIIQSKRYTNFNMTAFTLSVYGTCKICRRKPKKAIPFS